MKFVTARDFVAAKAWDALSIAEIEGTTIRLHWTDRPYIWHVNDGAEVFVVVDDYDMRVTHVLRGQEHLLNTVNMHYRRDGEEHRQQMRAGDICHAEPGDEHVAHPIGPARVLVIEKKGSV